MKKILFILPILALAFLAALILGLKWLHDFEQLDTKPEQAIIHYKLPESMVHQAQSIKRDMDTDRLTIQWENPPSEAHDELLKAGWIYDSQKQCYEYRRDGERRSLILEGKKAVIIEYTLD